MTAQRPRALLLVAAIASLALHGLVLFMLVGVTSATRPPRPRAVEPSLRLVVLPVERMVAPIVAPLPIAVAPMIRPAPRRIDAPPRPVRPPAANTPTATPPAPMLQRDPAILTVPQYRVALAFAARRAITDPEPFDAPDASTNAMRATVRLAFDAAGELIDVRLRHADVNSDINSDINSDLDARFAAQATALARRAAQALPVPPALRGRAFYVDLVIAFVGATNQATR